MVHPDDNGRQVRQPKILKTDVGNAQRLAREYGADLRYVEPWAKWLTWDGRRWSTRQSESQALAKRNAIDLYADAARTPDDRERRELVAHAEGSQSASRIRAALYLAQSEPGITVEVEQLDTKPWLLNVKNGTIDLRTGQLRPHDRADLLTQISPNEFDAAATCPTWDKFIYDIFGSDPELIAFAQKLLGYCLTGQVSEQKLPIFWGTGANGKSTLVGVMLDLLGPDYAMKAPSNWLMARGSEQHPTELADLHGKRLVAAVETESGRRLAEVQVKELTGGDRVRARRMREDFWEFSPTHKVILSTNHRPEVRGTDHAIWRRLALVPFTQTFDQQRQDKKLPEKLRSELQGILAWCVRGCVLWQAEGLTVPKVVTSATADYRDEQDAVATFLAECCVTASDAKVKAADLYAGYRAWCEAAGEQALTLRHFGERMTERGFQRFKNVVKWYRGVGLINGTTGPCGT